MVNPRLKLFCLPCRRVFVRLFCLCRERLVFSRYVQESLLKSQIGAIDYIGVDIDPNTITIAQQGFLRSDLFSLEDTNVNYQFVAADATKLEEAVEGNFDAIFISHPQVTFDSKIWKKIMPSAIRMHDTGGLLVSTFHYKDELPVMKSLIEGDYQILVATENRFCTKDPHLDMYAHKYLLAGVKK